MNKRMSSIRRYVNVTLNYFLKIAGNINNMDSIRVKKMCIEILRPKKLIVSGHIKIPN